MPPVRLTVTGLFFFSAFDRQHFGFQRKGSHPNAGNFVYLMQRRLDTW